MFFGLFNALASFQGYINKIFTGKLNIFVIVNLNDILIYTKEKSQPYINLVYWVLEKFQKHGIYTNFKKYYFHKDEVRFPGFVVST